MIEEDGGMRGDRLDVLCQTESPIQIGTYHISLGLYYDDSGIISCI